LGGALQTFGQQHFVLCSGQLASFAAAFQLALSRRPESVAVELNATNTNTAAMSLKRRCIARMLSPETDGSKAFLICTAQGGGVPTTSILGLSHLRLVAWTQDDWKPRVFWELWITG